VTRPRWRATDAHVDESQRGSPYVMACVLTDVRDHAETRRGVEQLMRPGQRRIHFHDESLAERRRFVEGFAQLPIRVIVVAARVDHGVDAERARALCLSRLVRGLQDRHVSRVVLESRHDDRRDVRTIIGARRPEPLLVFEHRQPAGEPLLWIADGAAWAGRVRGAELDRLAAVLDQLIDVDP
jgi:hypothetical protein